MKLLWGIGWCSLAVYLLTGWCLVGSDEKAVVRRFGRQRPELLGSGLHYVGPWPWCRVDRVNFTAVRTLVVGRDPSADWFSPEQPRSPAFLTGDKNLLLLRASVQYRLAEESIAAYLYEQFDAVQRLRLLTEEALTELAAQSGVDYLHTFGLAEVNQHLTKRVREAALAGGLGLEVDQVTLEQVEPPARVQAEFLEVANARADAARAIHEARTFAEQRLAAVQAEAEQLRQQAEQQRQSQKSQAQGTASRFQLLVNQLQAEAERSGRRYEEVRALAMQRMTYDTLREVLSRASRRLIVESREPIELYLPDEANVPPVPALR